MALLQILHHPDPRLRQKAKPVETFDDGLHKLIEKMFETMYAAPGVGLAATQVGVALRVAVMDCTRDGEAAQPLVLINPEIQHLAEPEIVDEGCLSVPGVSERVKRYARGRVSALDRHGRPFEMDVNGLMAQCVQHEIDHLDGKLYIDHLSAIKRERLLKRMKAERTSEE